MFRYSKGTHQHFAGSGVDINLAAQFPHRASTLQFVSGLGPRKAQAMLIKISNQGGRLDSRPDLIQNALCGANVYMNCASFIRIRHYHCVKRRRGDAMYDVLDDTRIHPEDYELARKMAADALDVDESLDEDENPSQHVRDLMEQEHTDRLNLLLLDDYALELEKTTRAMKRICLDEIKNEIMFPYKERRRRFDPPSTDELFYLLSNESEKTLYRDMLVGCQVTKVFDKNVRVMLNSGMEGSIFIKNLSDGMISTCSEEAQLGQFMQCRVIDINKEKFVVELSARIRDVNEAMDILAQRGPGHKKDRFFSVEWERSDQASAKGKLFSFFVTLSTEFLQIYCYLRIAEQKKRLVQKKSSVNHPFFKSVDYKEAENILKTAPNGEVIIRPSTKGPEHLSLTWKVDDGIVKHIGKLFKFTRSPQNIV
jgi:transcription elongation factor SPT6